MRVLISAPSLDAIKNVSGISTAVLQIRRVLGEQVEFVHLEVGSEQAQGKLARAATSLAKSISGLMTVLLGRYDILHSNTALERRSVLRDLGLIVAARLRRKPVLLHLHGGTYIQILPGPLLRLAVRALIRHASRIVVLSERERAFLADAYPESLGRTDVIYNGIDVDDGFAHRERPRDFSAVFAGRLVESKGIRLLLEACRVLPENIAVTVYGRGPLLDEVRRMAAAIPRLKYAGIFTPQKSLDIISRFHALVLPSHFGEGMPMAIVEAMSVGTIPVCTALSSIPEIVRDGSTGVLVEPDAFALAKALVGLNDAPERRSRMSAAARDYAGQHLSAKKNFGLLIGLYRELLGS